MGSMYLSGRSGEATFIDRCRPTPTTCKEAMLHTPSIQIVSVGAKLICKHKGLISDLNVKACQPI